MKVLFALIALFLSATPTFASGRDPYPGSHCGLVDVYGDESTDHLIDSLPEFSIDLSKRNLKLSTLQKQQIIVGAQWILSDPENKERFKNSAEAIAALNAATSDGAYLGKMKVSGVIYDRLMIYPGDNPVGVLFKEGTLRLVGGIADSDMFCINN